MAGSSAYRPNGDLMWGLGDVNSSINRYPQVNDQSQTPPHLLQSLRLSTPNPESNQLVQNQPRQVASSQVGQFAQTQGFASRLPPIQSPKSPHVSQLPHQSVASQQHRHQSNQSNRFSPTAQAHQPQAHSILAQSLKPHSPSTHFSRLDESRKV